MIDRRAFVLAGFGAALSGPATAQAAAVRVAVAANFTTTAKVLAQNFEARTGHRVIQSFGSSGQFYAQITNGAPFDIFLSADTERPQRLEKEGFGIAGTRFTYARGALVLWSAKPNIDAKATLLSGRFDKLAIAEPATAPYGLAAGDTLRHMGVYDRISPKVVRGSSIAQAHSFVATGAAELGFVALSQIQTAGGSNWRVPQSHYSPIDQQALLLKDTPAARAYLRFLRSPDAHKIIRASGYGAG